MVDILRWIAGCLLPFSLLSILTEIRLVDIFYPISYHSIWDDEEIKLHDELPLLRGVVFRVPVPEGPSLTFSMHLELKVQRLRKVCRMARAGFYYRGDPASSIADRERLN